MGKDKTMGRASQAKVTEGNKIMGMVERMMKEGERDFLDWKRRNVRMSERRGQRI